MQRKTYRLGWVIAVMAMAALACTCGALGQAQEAVQTAQALATAGNELATQAQGFATEAVQLATQVATTGAVETLQAVSTDYDFGAVPPDMPIFPDNDNLFGTSEAVAYFANGTVEEVTEFYKTEMPGQGWAQSQEPISAGGASVLTYTKDNREAIISIADSGTGQTGVTIGITTK